MMKSRIEKIKSEINITQKLIEEKMSEIKFNDYLLNIEEENLPIDETYEIECENEALHYELYSLKEILNDLEEELECCINDEYIIL